ncbi:hypothetical protein SASPL_153921 [Salvia splendens]|uniref:DYW domain-containing protein n=1 Tax=Salvia splendens TaxID=180675 RepID=A0A8X8VZ68_SALSN|nr:hypothetical protein SASPL_153921 [Salvia splendens]
MAIMKEPERLMLRGYLELALNLRTSSTFMLSLLYQGKLKAHLSPPGLSICIPILAMFPCVACSALIDGTSLHCCILESWLEWDVFVASSLVHMYCRFGFADRAYTIFKDMPFRDTGCWNSMISGFFQNDHAKEALSILDDMILEGVKMDSMTVATILSVCAQLNDLFRGMLIHLFVTKHGLEFNVFVSNALINIKNNHPDVAIKFFHRMQVNKVQPDLLTVVSLSSCVAQMKDPLWALLILHERLAIIFGILNTPPKTCIRIYKNLRVCGDCHSVTKLISKLTEREIILSKLKISVVIVFCSRRQEVPDISSVSLACSRNCSCSAYAYDTGGACLCLGSIAASTNNFSITNQLGQGGFGPVYKGDLANGQFCGCEKALSEV